MPHRVDKIEKLIQGQYTKTSLDLSKQELTDEDIKIICTALRANPHISTLNVSNNPQITNKAAKMLANNQTLSTLRLFKGNKKITTEGKLSFMSNTHNITCLPIHGGSGDTIKNLRAHIKNNKKTPKKIKPKATKKQVLKPQTIKQRKIKLVTTKNSTAQKKQNKTKLKQTKLKSLKSDKKNQAPQKLFLALPERETARHEFNSLMHYTLFDLADFEDDKSYAAYYLAIALNLHTHNSSMAPSTGYGDVSKMEEASAQRYTRSQVHSAHRKTHDHFARTKSGQTGYMPFNKGMIALIKNSPYTKKLSTVLSKIKPDGFKKEGATLEERQSVYFSYSGVRNNHTKAIGGTLLSFLENNSSEELKNKILADNLRGQFGISKKPPKKIKKLSAQVTSKRIKDLGKRFANLKNKPSSSVFAPNIYSSTINYKIDASKKIKALSKNYRNFDIISSDNSTCCTIQLNSAKIQYTMSDVFASFFAGMVNYKLGQSGIQAMIQRRQSFGFLRTTVTHAGNHAIRLSMGLDSEAIIPSIIEALNEFDALLERFNFITPKDEALKALLKQNGTDTVLKKRFSSPKIICNSSYHAEKLLYDNDNTLEGRVTAMQKYFIAINNNSLTHARKRCSTPMLEDDVKKSELPSLKLLNNTLNYAIKSATTFINDLKATNKKYFKHACYHTLQKLHQYCTDAQTLLGFPENYHSSYFVRESSRLIERLIEYLISLNELKRVNKKDDRLNIDYIASLKLLDKHYASQKLHLPSQQINMVYTDSGQQANVASLLALADQNNHIHNDQPSPIQNPVYLFPNSYFEMSSFMHIADDLHTTVKSNASIIFIDILNLTQLKFAEFQNVNSLIIDITNNPTLKTPALKAIIASAMERNITVFLTESALKHQQFGLDKFQAGKITTILPKNYALCTSVSASLAKISSETMTQTMATYFEMLYTIGQEKEGGPKKQQNFANSRYSLFAKKPSQIKECAVINVSAQSPSVLVK